MVFQMVRANTALMSIHYDNGTVPGDRVTAFAARRELSKKYLDSHPSDLPPLIDGCIATTSKAADEQSKRRILMWGKTYYELVEAMVAKTQALYGLH